LPSAQSDFCNDYFPVDTNSLASITGKDSFDPNGPLHEVVQSSGLVFSERGELHFVLSKPKILPLKGKALRKMEEKMKEEQEMLEEMNN